jgi:hypothetical protein
MRFLGPIITSGKVSAVVTVVVLVVVYSTSGGKMFSTGGLSDQHRGKAKLNGVSSHAEIAGNCSACHAPAWSKETMSSRCLDCHANVKTQLDEDRAMHGRIPNGRDCRRCHTEHKGAHAQLTSMAEFDHHWTDFKLTGKHLEIECRTCHSADTFDTHTGKSHACVTCHADPVQHKGKFGTNCARCHTTETFKGATFTHRFPIDHGARKRGSSGSNSCSTCHKDENDYKTYTCYGCHEHQQAKMERLHARRRITNLDQCANCHRRGKERDRRGAAADINLLEQWLASSRPH